MRFSLFIALLFFLFNSWASDEAVPSKPVKFGIQYFQKNNESFIALNFENHPKWHTYWKNPGDAGLPIKNIFTVKGKEVKFEELEWPAPRRFIEPGNLWAYGYEDAYTLFFKLSKKNINSLKNKDIQLKSTWLVCKHICVPGQQITNFTIAPGKFSTQTPDLLSPLDSTILEERFNALPAQVEIPDYLSLKLSKGRNPNTLVLSYTVDKTVEVNFLQNTNLMYAFPRTPFDVKHESLTVGAGNLKGITEIAWDGEYQDPPLPFPTDGKFKTPYNLRFLFSDPIERKVVVIEKKFSNFDLDEVVIANSVETNNSGNADASTTLATNNTQKVVNAFVSNSMTYYLVLAFIGGLILNVMPCVLPVISIKLFGLVKYKNESHKAIIKHNIFYTLGILFTFTVLATIILSLRSIGTQVGWGFQLQSPTFISVMVIALFTFALNLFGLFEFTTPSGSKLGNIELKEGLTGDFFSGVLATVLSTPCSAPFLGTALTFAFSSTAYEIYLIFCMIGLGLAFPFIVTGIYPKLVSFLPKPGNWMNTLKKLLGISLLLTILWLLDVYIALVDGTSHFIKLGTILIFIFLGFFIINRKEKWIGAASFLAALGLFINLSSTPIVESNEKETALIRDKQSKGLDWQPWSEEKMREHKTNRKFVFIDFTAKWCFTCKVNEKLVLETPAFKKLVAEKDLKLLIGDWTKRDEIIGSFLRKHNMVGVPAYFVQKSDGTLINLGETVSIERIKEHLN